MCLQRLNAALRLCGPFQVAQNEATPLTWVSPWRGAIAEDHDVVPRSCPKSDECQSRLSSAAFRWHPSKLGASNGENLRPAGKSGLSSARVAQSQHFSVTIQKGSPERREVAGRASSIWVSCRPAQGYEVATKTRADGDGGDPFRDRGLRCDPWETDGPPLRRPWLPISLCPSFLQQCSRRICEQCQGWRRVLQLHQELPS